MSRDVKRRRRGESIASVPQGPRMTPFASLCSTIGQISYWRLAYLSFGNVRRKRQVGGIASLASRTLGDLGVFH